MSKSKHLILDDRITLEISLNDSLSFKAIAKKLDMHCTSISKEVKKHITTKKVGSYGRGYNDCANRYNCDQSYICENPNCKHSRCRFCSICYRVCNNYKKTMCQKLLRPPYVCNPCETQRKCTLEKSLYKASVAQKEYELSLYETRSGITIDEEEALRLDRFISPLLRNGQSIHHICSNNRDVIMHSEKSIYNYIDGNLFTTGNIDLPRKVRYRKRKSTANNFKVDKGCRIGRTYDDFNAYMKEYPDAPVVEMDSVEGTKSGKVMLTIHFVATSFMLAFLRDANTSQSVIDIFDTLYEKLGADTFKKLFPLVLGDNGKEFSNPLAIEFDKKGNQRTRVFYCDPGSPYQKGALENNHELIRRIIPKGNSLNSFTQEDIRLMMNHVNSYGRMKLNDKCPYMVFNFIHGVNVLRSLDASLIAPNEIIMKPKLLKK